MKLHEFQIGDRFVTPTVVVTLDDIINFAGAYDPLYFHIDTDKAKNSIFGRVVASGLHSIGLLNAEWVRMGILEEDIQGGVAVEVQFMVPVYPDDEIHGEIVVENKKENSDGRTGLLTLSLTGRKKNEQIFSKAQFKILVNK
ncbi:MaoC/PaaZ C-terminal domain-containing protein [Alicyclobacillus dauci]|uniref:MaoC/PaaZ C-terminal domain-containing protein n=1 Tax=Alicyclobacillus dauci TaxID=1475485 RepID=A0ABY6Z805_9BACL|nr:MaoC/PaaZ C-terminal domain-containing protein [Alicyclobacillus dauci]WAH38722.1 MaoC/PaaZ C-terminal domain-containing protein [Alicyclobacillus dauci]